MFIYCVFFNNSEITQSEHEIQVLPFPLDRVIHNAVMVVTDFGLTDQCNV